MLKTWIKLDCGRQLIVPIAMSGLVPSTVSTLMQALLMARRQCDVILSAADVAHVYLLPLNPLRMTKVTPSKVNGAGGYVIGCSGMALSTSTQRDFLPGTIRSPSSKYFILSF